MVSGSKSNEEYNNVKSKPLKRFRPNDGHKIYLSKQNIQQ